MTSEATPGPIPETVAVRVAGRLGMQFFLNCLRIACDGRDLVDGLILMAIGHANLEHLDREPELQARFAGFDEPPPAELVRPISVNALAGSLRMPFETVRRRTLALRADGACAVEERGLVLPPGHLGSERDRMTVFSLAQQAKVLLVGLSALGVLRPSPGQAAPDAAPPRPAARLAVAYCLRQLESLSRHIEDPTVGVLLIHVIRITTDHLDDTYTEFAETEDLVRDDLRRPVATSLLAERVGLPRETVRRHVALLLDKGWVARAPAGGLHLTREMLRAAPWPEARRENVANLNRLVGGLVAAAAARTPHA
jgi:hypothetical protein